MYSTKESFNDFLEVGPFDDHGLWLQKYFLNDDDSLLILELHSTVYILFEQLLKPLIKNASCKNLVCFRQGSEKPKKAFMDRLHKEDFSTACLITFSLDGLFQILLIAAHFF